MQYLTAAVIFAAFVGGWWVFNNPPEVQIAKARQDGFNSGYELGKELVFFCNKDGCWQRQQVQLKE